MPSRELGIGPTARGGVDAGIPILGSVFWLVPFDSHWQAYTKKTYFVSAVQ